MESVLLIALVIAFSVLAQLVLKFGQYTFYYPAQYSMTELAKMLSHNLGNSYMIVCIICTFISGLIWLLVIQNMPLNRAYPLMSLNYVVLYFLSWWLFCEPLSLVSLIGIGCIMIGTGLLGFK